MLMNKDRLMTGVLMMPKRRQALCVLLPPANVVCEGYVFTGVCLSTGGWYPSMHCRPPGPHQGGKMRSLAGGGLQAHTQGEVKGSGRGVSRPTARGKLRGLVGSPGPHLGVGGGSPGPHLGGIPACTESDTP